PDVAQRVDELTGCSGLQHPLGRSAGAERGELRERDRGHLCHQSARRSCALTSTVVSTCLTDRSMRAEVSSTAPTFARTATSAPSSGWTTTGRVKRTPYSMIFEESPSAAT